jgi:hypothetical protein
MAFRDTSKSYIILDVTDMTMMVVVQIPGVYPFLTLNIRLGTNPKAVVIGSADR